MRKGSVTIKGRLLRRRGSSAAMVAKDPPPILRRAGILISAVIFFSHVPCRAASKAFLFRLYQRQSHSWCIVPSRFKPPNYHSTLPANGETRAHREFYAPMRGSHFLRIVSRRCRALSLSCGRNRWLLC